MHFVVEFLVEFLIDLALAWRRTPAPPEPKDVS
jgi:hypothetical protein